MRYGWRVKAANFTTYVLAEYTLFWHHPNGKCYGEADWVPDPPLEDETGDPDPAATGHGRSERADSLIEELSHE